MTRAVRLSLLFCAAFLIPSGQAFAQPDTTDTRLLSMPAVSAKNIAFVYADDLWVADLDGKNPRQLTTDLGVEIAPGLLTRRADDCLQCRLRRQYRRLHHPRWAAAADAADLASGPGHRSRVHAGRQERPLLVEHDMSIRIATHNCLPFRLDRRDAESTANSVGIRGRYSPDGEYIAYTPVRDASAQWKHYRGGTHSPHLDLQRQDARSRRDSATEGSVQRPRSRTGSASTLYFRSDRAGEYNVFSYDTESKEMKQVTRFTDFPVIDINTDGKKLILEQAGYLHLLTPGESQPLRLKVGVAIDGGESRPRFAKGSKYVRDVSISPSGSRAAVEFRGEIVTIPAEKGDARNLTNTSGAHERSPAWSPDGKTIAYFSDAGGEYQLVLAPQTGKGETRKIKLTGNGFYFDPVWSRDSKKLLYRDNAQSIYWLDVASGKITRIVEPKNGLGRGLKPSSWSPDSKWVTYAMNTPAQISRVFVYSLEQNKSFPVTDGLTEATEPVFDAGGKYLYFLSLERHRHEQARLQPVGGRQPRPAVVDQSRCAESGSPEPIPSRERRREGRARETGSEGRCVPRKMPRSRSISRGSISESSRSHFRPGTTRASAPVPRDRSSTSSDRNNLKAVDADPAEAVGGGATLMRYDIDRRAFRDRSSWRERLRADS